MSYRITEDCISCGNCSVVCPQDAIDDGYITPALTAGVMREGASGSSVWQGYSITGACNGCGTCVEMCPVGAIIQE